MSLFIRLSIVAAIAVMLRCVPATLVITAPSEVTDRTADMETHEQGHTVWICSALAVESPWNSYANIQGYLEGANAEKKDFSNFVLYPVMELFHASESSVCVYLPAEDHCYPPAPITNQVKVVKQLSNRKYYAIRFWGQASDARVQYYKEKLTAAINTQSKAANFDLFFVSFFSDHVREVRYDAATTVQPKSAEPLQKIQSQDFTCPTALDPAYTISSPTTQVAGLEYFKTTLPNARLNLSDVHTLVVHPSNLQNQKACATAAYTYGLNAFSIVSGACIVYRFKKNFCPCPSGDFDIYIIPKRLGVRTEILREQLAEGVTEMVIYSEIPLKETLFLYDVVDSAKDIKACAALLNASSSNSAAFFVNNTCYLSPHHDLANCQQSCRGQPIDVLVKTVGPFPQPPILSLCGKQIVIPRVDFGKPSYAYTSHAGFGCYRYQGANNADEDCIVTFEKHPKAKRLQMSVNVMRLSSRGTTCLDELRIYNGTAPVEGSLIFSGCSGNVTTSVPGSITVKFRRGPVSENNIGFKLGIGSTT